jgi:hypothetical protein
MTGYNRKYAITLFRHTGKTQLQRRDAGSECLPKYYDEPVEKAALATWEFFHRLCGKRLVPMIRANLEALAREFKIPAEVQSKLAQMSRSTVERLIWARRGNGTPVRAKGPPSAEHCSNTRFPSEFSGDGTTNPRILRN